MPKSVCENRDEVHVDNRLHSPRYGRTPFEFSESMSMCYVGQCWHDSYNAWLKATKEYIRDTLAPQLNEAKQQAANVSGGGTLPMHITNTFNNIEEFIDEWESKGFEEAFWTQDFRHPFEPYWRGRVKTITTYFDKAACYMDDLNSLLANELKAPNMVKTKAPREAKKPPGGGTWLGGDGGSTKPGSTARTALSAVGIVALGAGAYFGFKVLTE